MAAIEAKFASRCGMCDEMIEEGDLVVVIDDEWVHAHHEEED